jgi:hypothetical protein
MTTSQPTIWLVNGPILALYLAAGAIVYLLSAANDRICSSSQKETPMPPAMIALLTSVSNLLGVATLVLLANALSTATRLSMLVLPLLLLLEHYGMIMYRAPRERVIPASTLGGSVAGLAIGAWMFMRNTAVAEPISRVTIPGNVRTIPLDELLRNEGSWSVSLKLVVFYIVSCVIFFGLHALIKRASGKMLDCPADKRKQRTALAALLAFALNFMGVVTLILMGRSSDAQIRLAMVAFPLFLIAESYVKLMREKPQNRPTYWPGLIGSAGGMALASFFLLRGAPLH